MHVNSKSRGDMLLTLEEAAESCLREVKCQKSSYYHTLLSSIQSELLLYKIKAFVWGRGNPMPCCTKGDTGQ